MRNNIILLGWILLQSFYVQVAAINIAGTEKHIDTLEHRMIGPGISYTKFVLPNYPLSAYLLTVDLSNPHNLVETFQAGDQVGKTEAMTSAYDRLSAPLHTPLAGINGNFWIVSVQGYPTEILGVPHSGSARRGELVTDPNEWNRGHGSIGFAMIDENKKALIDDIAFAGKVIIPDKGEHLISQINRMRGENQLVMFNSYLGPGKATRTDNNGIEVFIKPVDNQDWKVNGDVRCVITETSPNQGANLLENEETVLSGSGTAQAFLADLSPGDTLTVNMGIKTLTDNQYPQIREMITGNALVMKDGVLTNRNYNEAYNSQLYPRTGVAASQDGKTLYLIVIDKLGKSVGASTETMCEILKAFGAYHAATMDGGGSAQMMLDGQIVNNAADGRERPVANGWFLYHIAPEDDHITQIAFEDVRTSLPSLARYKPTILGYNHYGVLVEKDVKDYTITCSDGLGTITEDGAFVANGTATSGTLSVSYNQVTISKSLSITASEMSFRLDSVLIDNQLDYPIEVHSFSNNDVLRIPPSLLSWRVEDNTICKIEKGVLKGLKNGKTKVYGSIGNSNDSLLVCVEIPESRMQLYDDFSNANTTSNWKLSASSHLGAALSWSNLPASWTSGMAVNFTYKSGRAPFIKLTYQQPLYALPDSINIIFHTGDIQISRMLISLRANNTQQLVAKELNSFTTGTGNTEIKLAISDLLNTNDIAIYPVWLDNLNFYLSTMTEQQSYALTFKEIQLIYNDNKIAGLHNATANNWCKVYPNPVQDHLFVSYDSQVGLVDMELFNVYGQKVLSHTSLNTPSTVLSILVKGLKPGYYLLRITGDHHRNTIKIIKE